MSNIVYVPIVKGKENDIKAFSKVEHGLRSRMKPLIEIQTLPASTLIEDHIEKFVGYLVKHVIDQEKTVDLYGISPNARTSVGSDAVIWGFEQLLARNCRFTPAYGFQRNDEIWGDLAEIAKRANNGFCFRVDIDDLDDLAEDTWMQIIERSASMSVAPERTDVLIDLRDLRNADVGVTTNLVDDFLKQRPGNLRLRSITVAGSSALRSVADIEPDGTLDVLRNELRTWAMLKSGSWNGVTYGDYGIVHPDFVEPTPNKYLNAKIRYTSHGRIHYFRGHGLLVPIKDFKQYHSLAETVRASSFYEGPESSYGDWYIDAVADHHTTSGSPATWVLADMNHHLTHTARQMSLLQSGIASGVDLSKIATIN